MYYVHSCVSICCIQLSKGKNVTLIDRSRQWVINCRRADLDKKSTEALNRGNVLCSEHFEPSLVIKTKTKQLLRRDAIPTLFKVSNPPPSVTPSRPAPKERICEIPSTSTQNLSEAHSSSYSHEQDSPLIFQSLKRKINSERCKNFRLRKKLKTSHEDETASGTAKQEEEANEDHRELERLLKKHLSDQASNFVLTQIRLSKIKGSGHRWSSDEKSLALSIYHASKKAYFLLMRIFKLPSPKTLTNSLRNLEILPGFSTNFLALFKIKVSAMTAKDKLCAVLIDEMSIKSSLKYDPHRDLIEGFEDWGWGRSQYPATSALVLMARGLLSKWKQPFAYVLSKGPVKVAILHSLVKESLNRLLDVGLVPKVLICDQGSNNRALFQRLCADSTPSFDLRGSQVFFMYDPPHLMKSMRNNLATHGFVDDGKDISWEHIVQFYEQDKTSPIRLAPKLKSRHIDLKNFAKLRVSLAVQVLSHSVAAGITAMIRLAALPPDAMATAMFAERMDQLFNCFNSKSLHSRQVMGHAISDKTRHTAFLLETQHWLANLKCKNKSGTLPCLNGWQISIKSLLMLWDDLRKNHGFHYLLTDRLNQDCLENLFAVVRSKGGHRHNPSPFEFRTALRQTMVDAILVTTGRQNCKDDIDGFLFNLQHVPSRTTVRSRLRIDVARPLQPLMTVQPITITLKEDNVLIYIAGYLANKLSPLLCADCVNLLQATTDITNVQHQFLVAKGYEVCSKGGLQAPSALLFNICKEMEVVFRQSSEPGLHAEGVRSHIIRRIFGAIQELSHLKVRCQHQKCDVLYSIVSLFTNVRLHHLVRCKNEEINSKAKSSRKMNVFHNL